MTNKATLKALKKELEKTLANAQQSLEQYLTASQSLDDWQGCVDAFQQLRGTFAMLEHQGAKLLCEEAVQLLQYLPVETPAAHAREFESLTQAVVLLSKYLEFNELGQAPFPEILLPTINGIRKARSASPLREGCFHRFDYTLPVTSPAALTMDSEVVRSLKKYRQRFQAGLLHALRDERPRRTLTYLAQSLRGVQRLLAGSQYGEYWRLVALAAEGLAASQETMLPATRRQWLGQIDREIRVLLTHGDVALKRPPSKARVQESLYFIALCVESSSRLEAFQSQHLAVRLSYTNRQLQEQIELLRGPGKSVLQSVSNALQDEFNRVKSIMNEAAEGQETFSAHSLRDRLSRIADTLDMVGLGSPANVMRRMWSEVRNWPDNAVPRADDLMRIADSVLYAESALSRLEHSGQRAIGEDSRAGAHNAYLQQARVAALDEMEAGISVSKRAVSAYMDSGRDTMHLSNVPATLAGVKGALNFMDAPEAVAILEDCMAFVSALKSKQVQVMDAQLDAFADALSSLEFFLEGLLSGQQNREVIRLARASLGQLPDLAKAG